MAAACPHAVVWQGLCAMCGASVSEAEAAAAAAPTAARSGRGGGGRTGKDEEGPKAGYLPAMGWGQTEHGLVVSRHAAQQQAGVDEARLLGSRRLALIVDLDKTLIHTTVDLFAAQWVIDGVPDIYEFRLQNYRSRYFTRLRPGTFAFLARMHELFEMHIYTMGTRNYALEILQLIDPTGEYFSDRILTKDESFDSSTKSLNLDILFPSGDKLVAIIDDTPSVWDYRPNLLRIVPYEYFRGVEEVNALPQDRRKKPKVDRCAVQRREASRRVNALSQAGVALPAAIKACLEARVGLFAPLLERAVLASVHSCYVWQEADHETRVTALLEGLGAGPAAVEEVLQGLEALTASAESEVVAPTAEACAALLDRDAAWFEQLTSLAVAGLEFAIGRRTDIPVLLGREGEGGLERFEICCVTGRWTAPFAKLLASGGISPRHAALVLGALPCLQDVHLTDTGFTASMGYWFAKVAREKRVASLFDALHNRCELGHYATALMTLRAARAFGPASDWDFTGFAARFTPETQHHLFDPAHAVAIVRDLCQSSTKIKKIGAYRPPPEDSDGMLFKIGDILADLHTTYFAAAPEARQRLSVSSTLTALQRKHGDYPPWILSGKVILFSGVLPLGENPAANRYWQKAMAFGAACVTELTSGVTHVVARRRGTEKVKRALRRQNVWVVHVNWLDEVFIKCAPVDEGRHLLDPMRRIPSVPSQPSSQPASQPASHPRGPLAVAPAPAGARAMLTVTPDMKAAMDKEIEDAMGESSSSGESAAQEDDRARVLGYGRKRKREPSDNGDSDSDQGHSSGSEAGSASSDGLDLEAALELASDASDDEPM